MIQNCFGGCLNFVTHPDGSHSCKVGGCGYRPIQTPWKTPPRPAAVAMVRTDGARMVHPLLVPGAVVAPSKAMRKPRRKAGFCYGEDRDA